MAGQVATEYKEQEILNRSFDENNDVLKVNAASLTPTAATNPSLVVSYNAAGDTVKLEKTISGTTYTKTISNADEVVSTTKTISAWS